VKFNQPEFEKNCIESIKKFTDLEKHTLTIHDNYPGNKNLGQLWNELIEESDDQNICLLNTDTLVEENWTRLEESLADPEVGAVGPITNKCGTFQAGLERKDEIIDANQLSGFCMCFTKKNWRKVGKFPEDNAFYGQESVFNRKLQDHGLTLKCDRRVFVHHFKGQSWLKARDAGEVSDLNREYGAMQYKNFARRLKELREVIPAKTRLVVLGAGAGNPYPTFSGIDQVISDFFGTRAVHLPMNTKADVILAFNPDVLIVHNTRYKPEWYEEIRRVKKAGVKTALYWMDLRSPTRTHKTIFSHPLNEYFDHIFYCAEGWRNDWEEHFKVKTTWLPQATIQHPLPPKDEKWYDVIHIGDTTDMRYHQNRKAVIDQFSGSAINVTQLNEGGRGRRIELSKRTYGLYGNCNWSLSVSPLVSGYTSDRTFHILGAGGCLIMLDPGGFDWLKPYGYIERDIDKMIKRIQGTGIEEINVMKKRAFEYAQSHELYKDRYIKLIQKLCG